jgi:hypothetical protein
VCKIEFPHQKALIADTKAFDQGRSALRHFLGSVATTTDQSPTSNVTNIGLEGSPPLNLNSSYKQDHKGRPENKMTSPNHESSQTTHVKLVNLLESTLWNRKLAPTLEDIVNALVAQIFEGIRDHCVASAEMKVSYVSHWQFYSHYNY